MNLSNKYDLGFGLGQTACTARTFLRRYHHKTGSLPSHSDRPAIETLQALIELFREHNPSHSSNINSICGIVFFGVPSQGMNIESLIPMVGDEQPNRFLLESLGRTSAVLVDQGREFRDTSNHENFKIVSFYETKMSPTAREVVGLSRTQL